ncbi:MULTISPECIES: TlpA disulfide reductase family protein [Pseudomonas]|uniref:TlpA family protein disulfide reductase n=1 Tax=Pseudomonas quercus TaxID=2722792 RepID=A0ABX0YCK1_9PSED|nr:MULTISPECIES: TlpA disulfide reductase family protein [Pseudomonas]MBF7142556.1 TlpA family protein disulfide reductase [Pseudomonas sp. LY10J]NJP01094.1 TlpA family protein disulfide reductase [Pseudomonas quercus]
MLSVSLGPLALSVPHLVLLAAVAAAMGVAWRCSPAVEATVFWLFTLAVAVARLGFVLQYWPQYTAAPWQMVDLRDGGFIAWAGLSVALAVALWRGWRKPAERRALRWGVTTGLAVWLAGTGLIQWQQQNADVPTQPVADTQGMPVSLTQYLGQPLVVNLWATWCPPCRREMPALVAAQKARPDVRFVYLNQGETPGTTASFLGAAGVNPADVLYDVQGRVARQVGAMAYPTTLFYGRDGRLLGNHLGELSPATLEHALKVFDQPN